MDFSLNLLKKHFSIFSSSKAQLCCIKDGIQFIVEIAWN